MIIGVATRAELRALDCDELPEDPERPGAQAALENYEPPNPTSFRLSITAEIGSAEDEGADLFFIVYTPDELAGLRLPRRHVPQAPSGGESYVWGKGVLVMREWSYEGLLTAVQRIVSPTIADEWSPLPRS